jgi:hypothetical protein
MHELIFKPANDPHAEKRVPFGAADEVRTTRLQSCTICSDYGSLSARLGVLANAFVH